MSSSEAVVKGTLNADGTLELDQKPNLPPGRVTVRMEPIAPPESGSFFDMLAEIWAVRRRAGLTPRSIEEVEAQRRRMRDDSEQELFEAGRLQEESRRLREQAKHSSGGQE